MPAARDKVLIAETDAKAAKALARDLQDRGVEALSAPDAISALALARSAQPEAMVINSELAGGGGLTALKRIRSNVFTTNIPVIVLVPPGGAKEREFIAAGAQECLVRTAPAADVLAAVERHMLQSLDFTQAPAETLGDPARMAALEESALLDTPPEESFDRLTRLAARLLGAQAALVSLVDTERQFFKSQAGLGEPWASARQTRLSHSFCQWVVAGNEQLVVADATEHPVLKKNLAVKDMGVIAYAGVPLSGRGGQPIGSFCAVHPQARAWSDDDLATLRNLGQVSEAYAALEQARRRQQEGGSLENLETSMHVAGKAIIGVTHILRRYGSGIGAAEHADLLGIIEEQAGHIVRLSGRSG